MGINIVFLTKQKKTANCRGTPDTNVILYFSVYRTCDAVFAQCPCLFPTPGPTFWYRLFKLAPPPPPSQGLSPGFRPPPPPISGSLSPPPPPMTNGPRTMPPGGTPAAPPPPPGGSGTMANFTPGA
ncbi:uncharacterized protein LOC110669155 [Hevea brasiliensis]|uniref:uncharacterized protein LOC110669155 n=1 Tax=Hevea brasiliensis TaxID=3981 RepID=UPI0025D095FD|nr:uncharacterized protein LOC110669155 [Hevea brasiliensis]